MQMKTRTADPRRRAVDRIAENRPTHRGTMHAQLMGAAGERLEREKRELAGPPHHLPGRHRRLTLRVVLHPPAAGGVLAAERQVDTAFVLLGSALDQRPI